MTDSQTLKYVCHDHTRVMSDKQIPKICSSCITETLHFRVMLESQIPQNVRHDNIRVMSDSRMPKNVGHVPRKFNIFQPSHKLNKSPDQATAKVLINFNSYRNFFVFFSLHGEN